MTDKKKNIEDVTNSPDDWDDFWFNEDLGLSYSVDEETMRELMKPRNPVSNYVDDVLNGKNSICKRESPLSE
jgi:hypothetical protein